MLVGEKIKHSIWGLVGVGTIHLFVLKSKLSLLRPVTKFVAEQLDIVYNEHMTLVPTDLNAAATFILKDKLPVV